MLVHNSDVAPAGVQQHVPLEWSPRDGLRSDQTRLPKDASTREALARQVGADGDQLVASVHLPASPPGVCELPALEALRRMWRQQDYRGTVLGWEELRWRIGDEQPPSVLRMASPDALEARYSRQRNTHGVGDTLHLTETGDAGHPDLMTPILTTPATRTDGVMGPAIVHD
jgi:transposase